MSPAEHLTLGDAIYKSVELLLLALVAFAFLGAFDRR